MARIQFSLDQFLEKVYPEPNTGCWLWAGAQHPIGGHGSLNAKNYNGFAYAHRFSFYKHFGDFDRSLCVCHSCDVPWCVNPQHLFLGTALENQRDKVCKGRQKRGIKSPNAKFTDRDIHYVRRTIGILSNKDLSIEFNVSDSLISMIRSGKRWRHLS